MITCMCACEHTHMHSPISVTKTGFFLNHASLPIPATQEDRRLYGGKTHTISHISLPYRFHLHPPDRPLDHTDDAWDANAW